MATIIVFASSLFVTCALIVIKSIELRYGKRNIVLGLLGKFDAKSVRFLASLKFRCLQIVQSCRYIVLVQSRAFLQGLIDKAIEKMIDQYKMKHSAIMGRRDIITNGPVSFYLKKIAENKGTIARGKIEESL